MQQISSDKSSSTPKPAPASTGSDDFTTSPKAMLFWIGLPILLLVAFALFSELSGAK